MIQASFCANCFPPLTRFVPLWYTRFFALVHHLFFHWHLAGVPLCSKTRRLQQSALIQFLLAWDNCIPVYMCAWRKRRLKCRHRFFQGRVVLGADIRSLCMYTAAIHCTTTTLSFDRLHVYEMFSFFSFFLAFFHHIQKLDFLSCGTPRGREILYLLSFCIIWLQSHSSFVFLRPQFF